MLQSTSEYEERNFDDIQRALDIEHTVKALESQLCYDQHSPEEVARQILKAACKFYDADWCGLIQVDLDLKIWTPFWWYNDSSEDKTTILTEEFESAEFLDRWVQAVRHGKPMIVPDAEEVKNTYPTEYNLYQRLGIQSVLGASLEPRPVALLAVRNPKRYISETSILRLLAYVLLVAYKDKKMNDGLNMAFAPENIESSHDVFVSLFGELKIYTSHGILREADLKSPKISRLLTYLLISGKKAHSSLEIAQALWPDDSTNPAKNMRNLIYRLRQTFGLISEKELIVSTASGYQFNPDLHIMTDYQQFDDFIQLASKASSVINRVELLKNAIDLYPQHFKRNLLFFSRDKKSRLNFYIDREVSFMDDMRNTSAPLYGKAEPATTKTTMSVREMRQLLGLGKTDSYWLLHKNLFEVILINDKRRIVISSFEKWYANQVKYHKVNGSPPGEELCKRSYSVPDAAEILKVKPETIYTLIRQGKLKTETTDFCMRIPKEEFERWYRSQSRYRTAADRERDREIEAQTISIPEIAKLLGIPRKNVYGILDCKKYRDCFVIERVADRPRITKKSFKAWLKSQSTYQLQKSKKETHEEPPLKLQCPKNGKYYSFQEIQAFYGISRPTLDSWVLKEGIPTMKLGRVKRIQKEAFDEVLKSKRKVEEDV